MSITVLGKILERRDTKTSWDYVNPVLPAGQLGWAYNDDFSPYGVKMGDGVNAWDDLEYWFQTAQGVSYQIAFTTSHTFHWQTDLIDGVNTYAAILGNNPPKYSFWNIADDGTLTPAVPQMTITLVSGLIDTIVIDMGAGNWIITF